MREAEGRNLVDMYLDWHSGTVNPKEQSLGPALFDCLSKNSALKHKPGCHMFLVYTGYTDEQKNTKVRPAADVCVFVNAKVIDNLTRNADLVDLLEKHLAPILTTILDTLKEHLQQSVARSWAIKLGVALVRAAMGKSVKDLGFPTAAGTGKALAWGEDKIMAIKASWADHLEGTLPEAQGLKAALGYQAEEEESKECQKENADEFTVPGALEAPPAEEPEKNAWILLGRVSLVQYR